MFTFNHSLTSSFIGLGLAVAAGHGSFAIGYLTAQDLVANHLRGQIVAGMSLMAGVIGNAVGPSLVAFTSDYFYHDELRIGDAFFASMLPVIIIGFALIVFGLRPYSRTLYWNLEG